MEGGKIIYDITLYKDPNCPADGLNYCSNTACITHYIILYCGKALGI